jgi:monofunctional biosynthetic peptidoglycan transglycosylase
LKKTWPLIKKIFLVIFIIHVCWFLYFIFTNFSGAIEIKEFKQRFLIFVAVAIFVAIIYLVWLRKLAAVQKVLGFIWKIVFTVYIIFFIYFLSGFIFNPPITFTQIGSLLQGNGLSRDYISYDAMGSNIKLAVIASEDQTFPDHDGFDLKAIKRAIKYNKRHPDKVRGASTLSQQTAKNVFLFQGGGFFRKGPEVFFTFTIETGWTKKIILERYLNVAEMGRGIFGVQAAARKYFNKDAKDLTRMEAAEIAACLPSPKRLSVKPLSNYVAARANAIVRQMGFLEGDPDIAALIK